MSALRPNFVHFPHSLELEYPFYAAFTCERMLLAKPTWPFGGMLSSKLMKNLHLASPLNEYAPYLRWGNNIKSPIKRRNYCKQTSRTPKDLFEETHPILQSSSLQHGFKKWQEQRKHKLTASTFAGAVGLWPRRRVQLWLEKIGSIEPFSGNLATCWSNIKEKEALQRYKLLTGNDVIFPKFKIHGDKNPEDDWLAASPDGVIDKLVYGFSPDGVIDKFVYGFSLGVLEMKCPFFNGDMSKGYPWTRVPLYCVPQAQGLMEILDRDWMDFYVWTPKGSNLFRIYRNVEYWNLLKIALSDFWWNHVEPAREMCRKSVITNPLVELRSYRPAPRHELYRDILYGSKCVVDESKLLFREIGGKLQN